MVHNPSFPKSTKCYPYSSTILYWQQIAAQHHLTRLHQLPTGLNLLLVVGIRLVSALWPPICHSLEQCHNCTLLQMLLAQCQFAHAPHQFMVYVTQIAMATVSHGCKKIIVNTSQKSFFFASSHDCFVCAVG